MMMIWLFSFKSDLSLKARLVVNGKMCKPGIDYDSDETYCGNVVATSIKIFFALSALYGLTLRGGDLVGRCCYITAVCLVRVIVYTRLTHLSIYNKASLE